MGMSSGGIVSLEEGLKLLRPIVMYLTPIPAEAFQRYNDNFRLIVPLNSSRGQGSDLHEIQIQIARDTLSSRPGVEIREPPASSRFLVIYRNRAIVQFKTLGKDLVPMNAPTEAAKEFDSQVEIPGLPYCTRFTVGPYVNRDGTELLGSMLVCTRGYRQAQWAYDMVTRKGVEVLDFPLFDTPDDDDRREEEGNNGEITGTD